MNEFTNKKERMPGRGLEDISHFFLSGLPPGTPRKTASSGLMEGSAYSSRSRRIIPFLSMCSNIPSAFFTCNIGLDLAQQGKEVFIVDVEKRQPNVESTFGLKPVSLGLSDILYPSESKIFRDVEPHLRLLDFRLELASLPSPRRERDKRLLELLNREEACSEWILINLPKSNMVLQNTEWVFRINEIVVLMEPRTQNLIEAYAFIKSLFSLKPDILIHVGVCDVSSAQEAKDRFDKLQKGVQLHLKKTLWSLGYLLKEPAIAQSIFEQVPILKSPQVAVQNGIRAMSKTLMERDGTATQSFFNMEQGVKKE